MCDDGHTYERVAIVRWLQQPRRTDDYTGLPLPPRSPFTNLTLRSVELIPNIGLRKAIEAWLQIYPHLRMKPPRMNLEDVRAAVEALQADAGSKQQRLEAQRVEQRRLEAQLVEKNAEISRLRMELKHAWQEQAFPEERDIEALTVQTGCFRSEAIAALKARENNIVEAIRNIEAIPEPEERLIEQVFRTLLRTGCSRSRAIAALKAHKNDIFQAVMNIEPLQGRDESSERDSEPSERDIDLVTVRTGCSRSTAIAALKAHIVKSLLFGGGPSDLIPDGFDSRQIVGHQI